MNSEFSFGSGHRLWRPTTACDGAGPKTGAAGYEKERGQKVSDLATGSGDGIKRIVAREVDFGASDSPLSPADLAKHRLVQFPTAVGGMVPVVNLSGELLAEIMAGRVTPLPAHIQARLVPRFQQVKPQDKQPLNFYSL